MVYSAYNNDLNQLHLIGYVVLTDDPNKVLPFLIAHVRVSWAVEDRGRERTMVSKDRTLLGPLSIENMALGEQ